MRKIICLLLCLPLFAFAKEKPVIVLDPGHGGKDQGAKVRTIEEKILTLRTAYLTKRHLEDLGFRVVLTRAKDIYLPLGTRVNLANRRPTSLFVSIHYNSAASPAAKGIEIYYYGKAAQKRRESSKQLANAVLNQMIRQTDAKSRGVKQGNFQVIRETTMPGILVEAGFITNAEERAQIGTQTYLDKLAKGIALGVERYTQ